MLQQQTDAAAKSMELAERATIRALLNSFLRETGMKDPRATLPGLRHYDSFPKNGESFILHLPMIDKTITGAITYYSAIGQHVYGAFFYEASPAGFFRELGVERLIALLLEELSLREKGAASEANKRIVKTRIENSLKKMSLYIEHYLNLNQPQALEVGQAECVRSEQSLYNGHPFHPYPKCTEGFDFSELAAYSPELGASFQLHYFAVRKALVYEEWLDGEAGAVPPSVILHARQQLGDAAGGYRLLPMHPWQADYMMQQPELHPMFAQRKIVSLGLCGPVVYPTSSVRTVWEPSGGYGYKLPLHVRITNLLRVNTHEQAERTMDAARVLHHIRHEWQPGPFRILSETGYSRVTMDGIAEEWASSLTVIYRPMDLPNPFTYVLASLLESLPEQAEPKLIQAIRRSGSGQLPDLREWLAGYLRISMLPLLHMLAEYGIAFEAHLQNSLVSLKGGMPDCFYVRDLEGVSIDRRKAAEADWIHTLVAAGSPVLYEESATWMRTKYYFFVNHLGSLIHTLAAYNREEEELYWRVVQTVLRQERSAADARLTTYIDDLLHGESLPAKANLTSCFLARGETPLFVDIPNPIRE
ncbi:IucA/IucC family protein [Paenibacillus sp. GCM10023248]|uniref:IucA/IucC family protein n=1 Tax=Bacillales TaxID=1385 RepID=UPI002378E91D|nr:MULTISPECIES: IucA/IucC family protein [Bacillales]MDD9272217.1 IucA/IucC family protein [Paenibacillus sp. MAHUQ-63]MDR6884551.1 siderophore synthetase component [Bacillus sp. 3255]